MNTLSFTIESGIGTLTINRPAALNALNREVLTELSALLSDLQTKTYAELKVLIITGSGEKAFVAGADIKEMQNLNSTEAKEFAKTGQNVFRKLENLRIPVIAAVNGFALGGGLELALACDFIYASDKARFGLPEVTLGLVPGFGGTVRLSRVVGINRAKEITMTGEMILADEALRIGLVNKVYPATDLMPATIKTAALIASRGPMAVGKAKFLIAENHDLACDPACQLEAISFGQLFSGLDAKEGMTAFVEKRKANFKGE